MKFDTIEKVTVIEISWSDVMKANGWKFEVLEAKPEDSNHWTSFDLEAWVAEVLWQFYCEKQQEENSVNRGIGGVDQRRHADHS